MSSKPDSTQALLSAGGRFILRLPALCLRGIISTIRTELASNPDASALGKIIGWPPPPMNASRETTWLDGLRGIAAFLVMAFHFHTFLIGFLLEAPFGSTIFPGTSEERQLYSFWRLPILRTLFVSGHAQVGIFFVLSGFVLSWGPLGRIRAGQADQALASLSSSVIRRWFRLYVPCFGIGLLAFVIVYSGFEKPPTVTFYGNIFLQLWDYVRACEKFARPLLRDRKYPNWLHDYSWIMWTIPIEFEGSILVFLLLLGMARTRRYYKRAAVVAFTAIYACVLGYWTYWLFATGLGIADYVRYRGGFSSLISETTTSSRMVWWVIVGIGITLAGAPTPNDKSFTRPGWSILDRITPSSYDEHESGARFWWSISGILIILGGCHLRGVQAFCESSVARYLGRISFMLYLTHTGFPQAGAVLFMDWYSKMYGVKVYNSVYKMELYEFTLIAGTIVFCVSWMIGFILAIPLAHWAEVLIDRPSVKLGKWLEGAFNNDESPASRPRETGTESESAILLPTYRAPAGD